MDVCVDVDPVRTLIVFGPHITAQCLSECVADGNHPYFLEYKRIVENGMKKSLELEACVMNSSAPVDPNAVRRKEALLLSAYELEPPFAARKVLETLKEYNEHESWMKEMSTISQDYHIDPNSSPTLQYILSLRREGARLVYTHYDELLARALDLPVVLMEDGEGVRKWSQGFPALLHLNGVFARPHTVKMDSLCYQTQVGEGKTADILREQFQSRAVVLIGFDDPYVDPHLPKILSSFASPSTMPSALPLLLTSLSTPPVTRGCLVLKTRKLDHLRSVLKVSSTTLGVAPMNDANHPVSLKLISADSQTTQSIIDILSRFPGIMARVNDDGQVLSLQMSHASLQRMWAEAFMYALVSRSYGLLSVHVEGCFVIRLQDKSSKGPSGSFNPSSGQLRVVSPLNSSLWKPAVTVATPTSSAMSQLAVPSPVIGSQQFNFVHRKQQQPSAIIQHDKVRRIRSENDGLVYRETGHHDSKKRNPNGLLTHQQSAPLFPYIASPGGLIQPGSQINIRPPHMFAVPPVLLNMEQKHQLIDQRIIPADHLERRREEQSKQTIEEKPDNNKVKGFEKKKSKFIREARQWSRHLQDKLHVDNKSNVDLSNRELETAKSSPSSSPSPYPSHFSSTHSPVLTNHKQPPTLLSGAGGMYTILPHSPSGMPPPGTIIQNHTPLIAAMQTLQQQSPKDGNNRVHPTHIPVTTPTLNPEQKFVYMLQDGTLIATTPIISEGQLGQETPKGERPPSNRSPKRVGSPNSDTDIVRHTARKRRRSSSLPLTNIKSPLSSSSDSTHSSPPPPTLFPIVSPAEPHPLPFPQITSPTNGRYGNIFFSGLNVRQATPTTLTDSSIVKMEGDGAGGDRVGVDNDNAQPLSPDNHLHPVPAGRGPIQLWQFLLDLLVSPDKSHMIQWTGNGYEFRIVQPEEIAKLWGARKNKPRMNYDKLSRGLRYYYSKGIMDKVPGKKLTFKYTCNIQQYMNQRASTTESTGAVSNGSL